jgi:hypothetical protein
MEGKLAGAIGAIAATKKDGAAAPSLSGRVPDQPLLGILLQLLEQIRGILLLAAAHAFLLHHRAQVDIAALLDACPSSASRSSWSPS